MIDASLAADTYLGLRKSLLRRISKLIMGIYNKIRDKKLKYDINKEAANISALSPGIIDKYEYLTYLIFTLYIKLSCSFLGKALEKQRNKQLDDFKPF